MAGIAKDRKSTHRWRSVELSESSWTFISALLERWVESDFVLLSNVDKCLHGLRLDDP